MTVVWPRTKPTWVGKLVCSLGQGAECTRTQRTVAPQGQSEPGPRLQASKSSREEAFVTRMPGGFPFPVRSPEDTSQEVLLGQEDHEPGAWLEEALLGRGRRR